MGRARRVVLVIASIAVVWVAGSAVSATKGMTKPVHVAPKPAAVSRKTARPVFPEWAPKNPSPEFLRAAKVLKPLPLGIAKSPARTDAENAARMKGATIKWTPAYEFFGTLSDGQVERFLQSKPKHLVIPVNQPSQGISRSPIACCLLQVTKPDGKTDGFESAFAPDLGLAP